MVCVCVCVYTFVRMCVIVYLQMCSECMHLVTVYVSLATGSGPVSVLVAPFPSTFTSIQYTTSSSKPSEHSLDCLTYCTSLILVHIYSQNVRSVSNTLLFWLHGCWQCYIGNLMW